MSRADTLLEQVQTLHAKAWSILASAEAEGDLKTALHAIRETRGTLELLAKLLGELNESPNVNVLILPEWNRIRSVLITTLSPYPNAQMFPGWFCAGVANKLRQGIGQIAPGA